MDQSTPGTITAIVVVFVLFILIILYAMKVS